MDNTVLILFFHNLLFFSVIVYHLWIVLLMIPEFLIFINLNSMQFIFLYFNQ